MSLITTTSARTLRGFTLVEVMVSLIVISVGLLGVVGMEAMALSSSANGRMRSLASLEAAGLAATMHANRDFWSGFPANVTISGGGPTSNPVDAISDPAGKLTATGDCHNAHCDPDALAAYDTQRWVATLNQLLPNPSAAIKCDNSTIPLTCLISIVWVESAVGLSDKQRSAEATAAATVAGGGPAPGFENNTYTLFVQP
jgi:type IV pilus assembly protein PilV